MPGQTDAIVEQISASTALVVVSDHGTGHTSCTFLSDAGFMAQLLACKAGVGSYRRHRREEPGIASDLYRATAGRGNEISEAPATTIRIA
jgi:hypothetical protein